MLSQRFNILALVNRLGSSVFALLLFSSAAMAAPADYADPLNPKNAPYTAERIKAAAETATRLGTAGSKIAQMSSGSTFALGARHKYYKGADPAEIAGLAAREFVHVGAKLVWPWNDCMQYKWRGFCGRTFKMTICVPIFGCADLYSWDLPTSVYREYHIPVAMADTTNVRGATGMMPNVGNLGHWTLVTAGQAVYERFAENKLIQDPLDGYRASTLIDVEMRRTYKAGANAAKNRGFNMPNITINSDLVRPLQQLARAGRDAEHRIGNDQKDGGGSVYATWNTPPGYPVMSMIYHALDLLNTQFPPLPIPIAWPPLTFNNPPYNPVVMAPLFKTCNCRRIPSIQHFVGSEYAVPLLRSLSPAGVFPNILARSPAVSHWYPPTTTTTIRVCPWNIPRCTRTVTGPDPEWVAKMSAFSGLTSTGNVMPAGDPMSALNADAARGGTQRWSAVPMAVTIPDMFSMGGASSMIQPTRSGTLPGTYRGNEHGWIHLNTRVQQAGNAAASEEAVFKAFKFAHMVWPKEYYNIVPGDDPDNSDIIQWTEGKLGEEKDNWGKDADEEDKDCKFIGHFTPEFKKANYIDRKKDVWNVAHLWKKVRCCDNYQDRPIDYGYFPYGFAGGADRYPRIDQDFPGCQNTDAP